MPELNGDQFGISKNDEAEMTGRAMGAHLFEGVEKILGGEGSIRQAHVHHAWDAAHEHFQGEDVRGHADDDGVNEYPVMHMSIDRDHRAEYPVGGPYVTMYRGDDPIDAAHVAHEDRTNPEAIKQRARDVRSWYDD